MALAPGRAQRPQGWLDESSRLQEAVAGPGRASPGIRDDCPFCRGHEDRTPPETWAMRPNGGPPDSQGWLVRSVPNLYPVFQPGDGSGEVVDPLEQGRGDPELHASAPAAGSHEVIVHTPEHYTTFSSLPREQFERALDGWLARLADNSDAAWVHLMVNEGKNAGASLPHSHAQLFAMPFVPVVAARERERFTAHNTRTNGSCLLCDLLQDEVRHRDRIVAVDDHAVLLAPYASRTPFELQLVPRRHARSMLEATGTAAMLLQEGLHRLAAVLGGSPPLNLWLRTAPRDAEHYHWRIDVVPRLTQLAGLELGAGLGVNVYPPERAAADLRDAG